MCEFYNKGEIYIYVYVKMANTHILFNIVRDLAVFLKNALTCAYVKM